MATAVAARAPDPRALSPAAPAAEPGWTPRFSLTVITYARDAMLRRLIAHLAPVLDARRDVEFILVDNNPDALDRAAWLAPLGPRARCLKLGENRGVRARNDGARQARGDILVFNDDDVLIEPADFLDRFAAAFAAHPQLGLVCARTVMADTGETPRAYFPHTNKQLPHDRTFKTFRFQANAFAIRRATYQAVGLMADDFFYGLEEIDYAYRVIKAGFEILHLPAVRAVEFNDPGGRRPLPAVERMRLANKFKISFLHMPFGALVVNIPLFALYVLALNRGKVNVPAAFAEFAAWAWRNRARRRPIDASTRAYIRACGGQLWK
jgi:GT2 family glycosyltransferase